MKPNKYLFLILSFLLAVCFASVVLIGCSETSSARLPEPEKPLVNQEPTEDEINVEKPVVPPPIVPPQKPLVLPALRKNLIKNGDFSEGMIHWVETIAKAGSGPRTTSIISSDAPYTNVLEVKSSNNSGCGGGSARIQKISFDASLYKSIVLKANVKIVSAGTGLIGGWKGGEYPVHFYVHISNPDKSTAFWRHGFYHREPQGGEIVVPDNSTRIEPDQWYKYTSPNLKRLFKDGKVSVTITLWGNGWNYQGRIDNIKLYALPVKAPEIKLPPEAEQWIKNLIVQLDDDDWQTRESAQAELIKIGEHVIPCLQQALKKNPSAEVKMRAQFILKEID